MKVGLSSGLLVALLAPCTAPRESYVVARLGEIGESRRAGLLVLHEASEGLVPVVIRGNPFAGRVPARRQHGSHSVALRHRDRGQDRARDSVRAPGHASLEQYPK